MSAIEWDQVGGRYYETGVDRGVLYLPNGKAVAWNGLTSIVEKFDKEVEALYYDGRKINDYVTLGDFSASLTALTYPDEFLALEGVSEIRPGSYVADQPPQVFGLCYRTKIGSDTEGGEAGYKLHILYNVTAVPSDRSYATVSEEPDLTEFEWELFAVPEDVPGFRPTSHILIDSRVTDPLLMRDVEQQLYGDSDADAELIPMASLVTFLGRWMRMRITELWGLWLAESANDDAITVVDEAEQLVRIDEANVLYLNSEVYIISDTVNIFDLPDEEAPDEAADIVVYDNGDGTWTAEIEDPTDLTVNEDGVFELRNANAIFIDTYTYELSSSIV